MVEDNLDAVLAGLGQRNSGPRKLLAEELGRLAASGEGFTAEELWRRLRKANETVGRATVFRAVKQLVESQILDCIDFSDGTRLYRVCGERVSGADHHHHHLACNVCHKIVDFHFCLPAEALKAIGDAENFRIEGHSLTVYGVCQGCRDK